MHACMHACMHAYMIIHAWIMHACIHACVKVHLPGPTAQTKVSRCRRWSIVSLGNSVICAVRITPKREGNESAQTAANGTALPRHLAAGRLGWLPRSVASVSFVPQLSVPAPLHEQRLLPALMFEARKAAGDRPLDLGEREQLGALRK